LEVSKIKEFEKNLYDALEDEKTILQSIAKEKILIDEKELQLQEIILKIVEIVK
jgi:hypothetical protein